MQKLESVQGPFTKIKFEKLNLNSHEQVKSYLLSEGWVPTTYNRVKDKNTGEWRTTGPKLTEDSFHTIKGETGQLIARRNVLVHRRRMIENEKDPEGKGMLSCIRDDGRVPANGILLGTPTGRTTHRDAVCNVPKAKEKVPYGIEIRRLFQADAQGRRLLGADLDQIEARVTAHYAAMFDGGEYWRIINETGDIHSYNAKLIDSDRDTAKSFQYALFYGAGVAKLAAIIGCSAHKAKQHLENFWQGNKGVYLLVEELKKQYQHYGFIVGLDGRKFFIRQDYKLLNSLIQGGAGIIWKRWGVLANQRLVQTCLDCHQVIAYHDEYEYDCDEIEVPLAVPIIKTAALDAGKYYNLTVPITADVKVGQNWAQVH